MNITLDFTKAETVKKLAALPHAGWAEALVRKVDPWWHAPEPPYRFKVHLIDNEDDECPHCGCTCNGGPGAKKSIWVEALNEDEAREIAEIENPGWFVDWVEPPQFPTAEVPPDYLKWFERIAA